jgi:TetR/AcrR family transcriptional repressor of multidrug resistance operon
MSQTRMRVDRAALIRRALLELVAEHGFRGTSMVGVAERAGVATGTAYVHYQSKDDLVLATYLEQKKELSAAGAAAIDPSEPPADRFRRLWLAVYRHLAADSDRARFLIQFDASPYAAFGHAQATADPDDALKQAAAADDMVPLLVELPLLVLYDLGIGAAVRLAAASDSDLSEAGLDQVAASCWRAITKQ